VMVAGGIGITPCHSLFRTLLNQLESYEINRVENYARYLPRVTLIWYVRSRELFNMFSSTWQILDRYAEKDIFTTKFYCTRNPDGGGGPRRRDEQKTDEEARTSKKYRVEKTDNLFYTIGKPQVSVELAIARPLGHERTLVFACGPPQLVDEAKMAATNYGAHYVDESFIF